MVSGNLASRVSPAEWVKKKEGKKWKIAYICNKIKVLCYVVLKKGLLWLSVSNYVVETFVSI